MDKNPTVRISPRARTLAEEKSAQEGYSSVDDYVDARVLEDSFEDLLSQPWIQEKIEEGLKSGNAGILTRKRLRELVEEGIALAERDKR